MPAVRGGAAAQKSRDIDQKKQIRQTAKTHQNLRPKVRQKRANDTHACENDVLIQTLTRTHTKQTQIHTHSMDAKGTKTRQSCQYGQHLPPRRFQ